MMNAPPPKPNKYFILWIIAMVIGAFMLLPFIGYIIYDAVAHGKFESVLALLFFSIPAIGLFMLFRWFMRLRKA